MTIDIIGREDLVRQLYTGTMLLNPLVSPYVVIDKMWIMEGNEADGNRLLYNPKNEDKAFEITRNNNDLYWEIRKSGLYKTLYE